MIVNDNYIEMLAFIIESIVECILCITFIKHTGVVNVVLFLRVFYYCQLNCNTGCRDNADARIHTLIIAKGG